MRELPSRVLVLGLGRSGEAVVRYALEERDAGRDVTVRLLDEGSGPALEAKAAALREAGADVELGVHQVEGAWDIVVASPGIPPNSPLMRSARETGTEVISELELAYRLAKSPFVAITGTNGKTTTTSLVAHLLNRSGIRAMTVGNIGTPVIGAVRAASAETVLVAEVSSFQAALAPTFHPRVAVLLNVTPDHIDWHGSLEAYEADKARVFANMGPGDTAVIDVDDEGSAPWAERLAGSGARVLRVSRLKTTTEARVQDGVLTVRTADADEKLGRTEELLIRGDHNVSNALAGAAAALAMGASPEGVADGLRTFEPIEHRLERAGSAGGVEFYNDSKATNPDAVLKALTAFPGRPIVVLLGGRNKGNDFRPLAEEVAARCRLAILFGESRASLTEAFEGTVSRTRTAETMAEAVEIAAAEAVPGDVVLLSPACASFDEFTSYGHRGVVFKGLVSALGARAGRSSK